MIEDGVFIGPAAVLTNDRFPRAINRDGSLKSSDDWELVGVTLRAGASLGANSVCVAPLIVGEWAALAANSVLTRDLPAGQLAAGNPAIEKGPAKF